MPVLLCGVEAPDGGCEWLACAGFLDCLDRTLANPKSDIKLPEADGGSFCWGFLAGEASRDGAADELADEAAPIVVARGT